MEIRGWEKTKFLGQISEIKFHEKFSENIKNGVNIAIFTQNRDRSSTKFGQIRESERDSRYIQVSR